MDGSNICLFDLILYVAVNGIIYIAMEKFETLKYSATSVLKFSFL